MAAATIRGMHWLLHASINSAVGEALRRHGHHAHEMAELDLAPDASRLDVLKAAQKRQWEIVTADDKLASAPFEEGFPFNRCIVFLQLEGGEVEQDDAIDRLFDRYKRLAPHRLYTVTGTRVKVRQLPARS